MISNSLGTYVIEPGQTITFDGRASFDLDGGGIASYRWYENGSGSHSSTSATFVKTYYSYGTFALKLRVTDHENTYDEKTVTIQVRPSVAGTKYYITDHASTELSTGLGSVRSTVNHLGQVVGQEDFWSYGLTMPGRSWNNGNAYDRYKFTGVERDSEGGLELDAFGRRNYDPELGMFLGVDRFHHKYPSNTSYHYALNNPIGFVDVNGDSVVAKSVLSGPGAYHIYVMHYPEDGNQPRTIVEGFPENRVGTTESSTGGWGNLVFEIENQGNNEEHGSETIEVPEGQTEEEFVENISNAANSYNNNVEYGMFGQGKIPIGGPNSTRTKLTGNSNSLAGSSLRMAGSNFQPSVNAPGWNTNVIKKKD